MDTLEKLKTLSADSQYDLACACATGKDEHRKRGQDGKWLYPVTLPDGGYTVLLKTLLSNACSRDCKYCPLRAEKDTRRCTLKPEEAASVFMSYLKRREVSGLFLSSGVMGTPDHTMDRINATARLLRYQYNFRGYIHLKIIPGASDAAIEDSLSLANAVSLNIETPGAKRFDLLSDRKDYMQDIIHPMKLLSKLTSQGNRFSRVKCTTQFIVGASDETDSEIVDYMFGLYHRLNFKRVYFSAYQKGLGHPGIPGESRPVSSPDQSFIREHRLYQADYLIRRYGFGEKDIFFDNGGNLMQDRDPKEVWAERHPEFYPVRINSSDREALLKVPGIGPDTAERILKTRRERRIANLEDLGIKRKRLEKVRGYVVVE
jgi:predicted DNA-binding helix-hairpin-helix protein